MAIQHVLSNKMTAKFSSIKGFTFATLAILVWGVTFVNTKALLNDFSAFEILVARFAAAYAALWVMRPRMLRVASWRDELLFAGMGLTGVALYQFLENTAINYTNASNVSILVSACPMATALMFLFIFRDKSLTMRFALGFVCALCGVAMVCIGGSREFSLNFRGDALAFSAMASWSVYSVLVTKANGKWLESGLVIRRTFFWALVFMSPFALKYCNWDAHVNAVRFSSAWNIVNLGFLGFIASAMAFVLWSKACRELGTVRVTSSLYFIPAVTAIVAHFALGEKLGALTLLGAVVIVVGMVITNWRRR